MGESSTARAHREAARLPSPGAPRFRTADAANLLALSQRRVRAMVHLGLCRPGRQGRRFDFSFQDLVLLRAAQALIQAKVPTRRVRQALRELGRHLGPGRMLSAARLCADGRQIVVRDGRIAWEADTGQMMLVFGATTPARKAKTRDLKPHR